MLTPDLVAVRRRGDVLQVLPLSPPDRERARELAASYLGLVRAHVGLTRGACLDAVRAIPVAPREQRLARGLLKLVTDRCLFEEAGAVDAAALRRDLFLRASAGRQDGAEPFDRDALVAAVAAERGVTPPEIERALYADLPDEHRLTSLDDPGAEGLVQGYDAAQVQAVLLRAVRVEATVRAAAPGAIRALFRRLKFLRLLFRIEPAPGQQGYRLEIDGPFSLFESVTKYGLALALAFPSIAACDEWELRAEVRWGRPARSLRFSLRGNGTAGVGSAAPLPDDVAALLRQLEATETPWRASVSAAVLELPGIGLCVPDLELRHAQTGQVVFLEALGYWSRDAVWKRVELVKAGLPHAIVFAVSKRLRVSEAALGDDVPGLLYVYGRAMSARSVLDRVEEAVRRATKAQV